MVPRMPSATINRLWTMLAHGQGGLFNASGLAGSLSISAPTVANYIDILCDLGLVRRLNPWFADVGKRLVKAPRFYVRDSGLLQALLRLEMLDDILSHPFAGASWEGMVVENIIGAFADRYDAHFYRTANGAEIDLVLVSGGVPEIAIEVKRSTAPSVERGFHLACDDLGIEKRWLILPRRQSLSETARHHGNAIGAGARAIGRRDFEAIVRSVMEPTIAAPLQSCPLRHNLSVRTLARSAKIAAYYVGSQLLGCRGSCNIFPKSSEWRNFKLQRYPPAVGIAVRTVQRQ